MSLADFCTCANSFISLAFARTESVIFDEIDTGISGRTAQKVSEKMAQIGQRHQVICITHLPQIAAMADSLFEIEKNVEENETVTSIHPLSGRDSRMAS